MKINKIIYFFSLATLLSCKKEDPVVEPLGEGYANGILVLNEGLYQQNNSSITFYSKANSSVQQQSFLAVNSRGLGDTANDLVAFNQAGNPYFAIAVNVSSQIEIVHAKSMTSIAQISLFDGGGNARQPRRVVTSNGKIYSCNFDGTVSVIRISSLYLIETIDVGENPDGMAVQGNKLYVANSGGLNTPNYDNTITVIDTDADTVLSTITARINCTNMLRGNYSDIYVISNGDYGAVLPAMLRIDTDSDSVTDEYDIEILAWDMDGDWLYYYDAALNGVYRYNTFSKTFEGSQIIDGSALTTPYTLKVTTENIYLVDANGYINSSTVKCYDKTGAFLYEFTAGLNATDFVFND